MIIRYERTVEYEIDVSPKYILHYAKELAQDEETKHVSLEDIIENMAEDNLGLYDRKGGLLQDQIDYSEPRSWCFPRLHEDDDPFCGVGITIEELEKNLKQFNEEED